MELAMKQVEKFESNISTENLGRTASLPDEKNDPGYISADLGLTARMSFRLNSPWKAIGAWIKKLAA
jgi:hypothetical protein